MYIRLDRIQPPRIESVDGQLVADLVPVQVTAFLIEGIVEGIEIAPADPVQVLFLDVL